MKKKIDQLCDNYQIEDIEKHLFHYYIDNEKIDISSSKILIDYFNEFSVNKELNYKIAKLEISSFVELEKSQELLIPKIDRKINGAFFTPRNIVTKIIDEIQPKQNDLCSDISCGCGSFLIGLIKYFKITYQKSINDTLKQNIFFYFIIEYNIRRKKILISIYGLEVGEVVKEQNFNLEVCDSIRKKWEI